MTAQPQRHKNSSHQSRSLAQGHMQINWPAAAAAAATQLNITAGRRPHFSYSVPAKPKRNISILNNLNSPTNRAPTSDRGR